MLRDWSRNTSCHAFHDRSTSGGASNSFSIQAEYRFSVARFQELRTCHMLPSGVGSPGGFCALTAMSRVILLHPPEAWSRASEACHVPAEGVAISANQKYGGPPRRSADVAATLPSGAISESSPSTGFSATTRTRSGAPFQGASGDGRTAKSGPSSQPLAGLWAALCARTSVVATSKHRPANGNNAVTAAVNRRARANRASRSALKFAFSVHTRRYAGRRI